MNILKHPLFYVMIVILIHTAIYLTITYRPLYVHPPETRYAAPREQTSYLPYIRQAKEGAWCIQDPRTTQETPCVYAYLFFVILGKITALFRLDVVQTYMLAQLIGGITSFIAIFVFLKQFFSGKKLIVAFLFATMIQIGPRIPFQTPEYLFYPSFYFMPPVMSQITFFREFGLPHHAFGITLGLLVLSTFISLYKKKEHLVPRILFIIVATLLGITFFPPYWVVITLGCLLPLAGMALVKKRLNSIRLPLVAYGVSFVLSALFVMKELGKGAPWTNINTAEKSWFLIPDILKSYGTSLLLYLPFILLFYIGFVFYRRRFSHITVLAIVIATIWLLLPLLLIPLTQFSFFPIAGIRIIDGYQYVPAAILASLFFTHIVPFLPRKTIRKLIYGIGFVFITTASLGLSTVYIHYILVEDSQTWSNVYVSNDFWDTIGFMQTLPPGKGVLAMQYMSQFIADFTRMKTYFGMSPGFLDWNEKRFLAEQIYHGNLSKEDLLRFLQKNHIEYIYYGSDEQWLNQTGTMYPDTLKPIYQKGRSILYQVTVPTDK